MLSLFAHLTPLEAPIVWLALFTGVVLGSVGTLLVVRRRNVRG